MQISEEVEKLKKELVFLRISKITKQRVERHKIKGIQNRIAQLLQLNQDNQ